jgi:YHS domain-containing protein
MTHRRTLIIAALSVTIAAACTKQEQPATSTGATPPRASATSVAAPPTPSPHTMPPAPESSASGLTLVTDRSLVCMVNNQFMGRAQIPVEVGGNTYYGCCEMCKSRLANDASARTAVDPVSNRPVDKSLAVIARTETGATLYFENEQNFNTYARQSRPN